jgi:hypothetical protein
MEPIYLSVGCRKGINIKWKVAPGLSHSQPGRWGRSRLRDNGDQQPR